MTTTAARLLSTLLLLPLLKQTLADPQTVTLNGEDSVYLVTSTLYSNKPQTTTVWQTVTPTSTSTVTDTITTTTMSTATTISTTTTTATVSESSLVVAAFAANGPDPAPEQITKSAQIPWWVYLAIAAVILTLLGAVIYLLFFRKKKWNTQGARDTFDDRNDYRNGYGAAHSHQMMRRYDGGGGYHDRYASDEDDDARSYRSRQSAASGSSRRSYRRCPPSVIGGGSRYAPTRGRGSVRAGSSDYGFD